MGLCHDHSGIVVARLVSVLVLAFGLVVSRLSVVVVSASVTPARDPAAQVKVAPAPSAVRTTGEAVDHAGSDIVDMRAHGGLGPGRILGENGIDDFQMLVDAGGKALGQLAHIEDLGLLPKVADQLGEDPRAGKIRHQRVQGIIDADMLGRRRNVAITETAGSAP